MIIYGVLLIAVTVHMAQAMTECPLKEPTRPMEHGMVGMMEGHVRTPQVGLPDRAEPETQGRVNRMPGTGHIPGIRHCGVSRMCNGCFRPGTLWA